MTLPRCVLPGQIVMVTRRCLRRTKLLRPDAALNQLYTYCLAVMAARHGVAVHAVVVMSTHEHLILTDTRGRLPLFLRELHRLIALGVKVLRRWEGAVWDHERPSVVHLRTQQAVIEKLAYVMANPVTAGLVAQAEAWPGVRVGPKDLGTARLQAARPDYYFDKDNPAWPRQASLELALPEMADLPCSEAVRELVADELRLLEQQAHKAASVQGRAFVGVRGVLKTSPFGKATSPEPIRDRNPAFAVGRGQRAAFFEAVAALRAFRRAYREALDRWRLGLREYLFPAGTWLMRTFHGAPVMPS
jgi:putative transposase